MDAAIKRIETMVQDVVRLLCEFPDQVKVTTAHSGGRTVFFVIHCNESDVKYIIGKHGKNIHALKNLTFAIASRSKLVADIAVNE